MSVPQPQLTYYQKWRNRIAKRQGISTNEASRLMTLPEGEKIVLSNGKTALARRSLDHVLNEPDEYYINILIDNEVIHTQYHYEG